MIWLNNDLNQVLRSFLKELNMPLILWFLHNLHAP